MGFHGLFPFLVSPDLDVPLILCSDFSVKTGLVLNVRFSFSFAFCSLLARVVS
jgi:hypothetical protein